MSPLRMPLVDFVIIRISYCLCWRLFCALVPGTFALIRLPWLICVFLFSVSQSVTTEVAPL